jgi:GNAT superfamily N-acetyltransferase
VANARFVEARASLVPDSGAEWIEIAGAYAMFDGPRSPCTQTFGLGLFQMPTSGEMDELESFFGQRGSPVFHEVCPLASKALLPMLNARGYKPIEFSNVMFMDLGNRDSRVPVPHKNLHVSIAGVDERELWARTAAKGWREFGEFAELIFDLMRVNAYRRDSACFLVELEGKPIASGGLAIHDGIALFAGASTVPEWRRRGAQQLLFEKRCEYALDAGCNLAMVCAEPGSSSQRNAERHGFRVAYTRTKWELSDKTIDS